MAVSYTHLDVYKRQVPETVQYFIDCNSPDSPVYEETESYADLKNKAPDQKYQEGSWGYLEEYGAYNGEDVYKRQVYMLTLDPSDIGQIRMMMQLSLIHI